MKFPFLIQGRITKWMIAGIYSVVPSQSVSTTNIFFCIVGLNQSESDSGRKKTEERWPIVGDSNVFSLNGRRMYWIIKNTRIGLSQKVLRDLAI